MRRRLVRSMVVLCIRIAAAGALMIGTLVVAGFIGSQAQDVGLSVREVLRGVFGERTDPEAFQRFMNEGGMRNMLVIGPFWAIVVGLVLGVSLAHVRRWRVIVAFWGAIAALFGVIVIGSMSDMLANPPAKDAAYQMRRVLGEILDFAIPVGVVGVLSLVGVALGPWVSRIWQIGDRRRFANRLARARRARRGLQ